MPGLFAAQIRLPIHVVHKSGRHLHLADAKPIEKRVEGVCSLVQGRLHSRQRGIPPVRRK